MEIDEAIKHLMNDWGKDASGTISIDEDKNDEWLEAVGDGVKALFARRSAAEKRPCDFCRVFDFSSARTQVDKYGARVSLALSTTRFDREEQFNYCPVCGRRRNE